MFDYNASWHWTLVCRNWEFQWVLPISSCKVWIKSVQYFLCDCYVCMCVSINPFVYLKSQYYFTFLACFFCFHFFTFCFGTANTQNILFKDKYFALLYWTSQLYLSTNFIYLNTISSFNGLYFMYFLHLLLLQHGDIDRNPGP